MGRVRGVWDSQRDALLHNLTSISPTFISPSVSSLWGVVFANVGLTWLSMVNRGQQGLPKKGHSCCGPPQPPQSLRKGQQQEGDGKDHLGWLSHSMLLLLQVVLGMMVHLGRARGHLLPVFPSSQTPPTLLQIILEAMAGGTKALPMLLSNHKMH